MRNIFRVLMCQLFLANKHHRLRACKFHRQFGREQVQLCLHRVAYCTLAGELTW